MTVYVDQAHIPAKVGRHDSTWCHLTADTQDELHAFAKRLGLARKHFQVHPAGKRGMCPGGERCWHWHYDVTAPKRAEAVRLGAVEIDRDRIVAILDARKLALRTTGTCQKPGCYAAGRLYPGGWYCADHPPSGRLGRRLEPPPAAPADPPPAPVADGLEPPPAAAEWLKPVPPRSAYNPNRRRHAWTKAFEHNRVCGYCLMWQVNRTDGRRWWQTWSFPDGRSGSNEGEASPKIPRCDGPVRAG